MGLFPTIAFCVISRSSTCTCKPVPTQCEMNEMTLYHYMAKDKAGKSLQGEISATTSQEAIQQLRSQDMLVTRLNEKATKSIGASPLQFSWKRSGVTNKELIVFTHQLATLIRAGVPLLECLDILGAEVENPAWHPILKRIYLDVEQGAFLAKALGSFPEVFHDFYRRMVEVGETTGRLDDSLAQLALYLDKQAQLRAKILSALAYPALLVTVAFSVLIFLLVWVVPLFSDLFLEFGESLPWLTKVVIHLADGIREHAVLLAGLLVAVFLGSRFMLTHAESRHMIDGVILSVPFVGAIFRKSSIVRFARTLGFLIRRGVPLLTGLTVAGTVTGNSVFEKNLEAVAIDVEDGKSLSETLRASGVFPPMVIQMIKVGESTGSLDAMLEKIADLFEQEVDRVVASFTAVLEPCVIVVVGSGIALVVIAMYLPIFTIGSVIG